MGFANIEMLWMLLAVPVLAGLLWLGARLRREASEAFRPGKFRKPGDKPGSARGDLFYGGGMLLAATLIIVALAGPYQNDKPVTVPEGPVQACFVVDVSRSMGAEDYRDHMPADAGVKPDLDSPWGSRLQMAKYQIDKILDAIPGNQACLVTYTEQGFGQAVLGNDFSALRFVLKHWVDIGTAPGDGSNYAHGIDMALDIFKDADGLGNNSDSTVANSGTGAMPDTGRKPAATGNSNAAGKPNATGKLVNPEGKQRVVILLTDGGFTGGPEEIDSTVARLKDEKVKLVIVGIGTPGENAIPLYKDGVRAGQMERQGEGEGAGDGEGAGAGEPLTASYDESAIRSLKSKTNAGYTHIALEPENQTVSVDWMKQISGTKVVYEKRMLDVYLAGAAYAIIAFMVIAGFFLRRRK